MILTIDLGTSATKAVLWGDDGPVGIGRSGLTAAHARPGWAEQDPHEWWRSVVAACAEARAGARSSAGTRDGGSALSGVAAVVFSAARETIVPVDADGQALGAALLWSDRRAAIEAAARCAAGGGVEALRVRTGVVIDAGATAAKADWLLAHQPDVMRRARWLLAPRDLVLLRLTGRAMTDTTLASRTGWYSVDGEPVADAPTAWLPPLVRPTDVAGGLLDAPAAELGVPAGIPVVVGAGDRACEVLGAGACSALPMVSWGTTANVSLPVDEPPPALPPGVGLSAGALGGHLLECGLSAAGAALEWLAGVTVQPVPALLAAAGASPAGARGVTATCWFHGARAPWWEPGGRAGFVGLTAAHGPGDLARALVEAVAFDASRSLAGLGQGWTELAGAGVGGAGELWSSVLAGVTGCVVERRQPALAASAGALLVAATALGIDVNLDAVNAVVDRVRPDPALVRAYRTLRPQADRIARQLLDLGQATAEVDPGLHRGSDEPT